MYNGKYLTIDLHNVINYDNEMRRLAVIGGIVSQEQLANAALSAAHSGPSRHG